MSGACAARAPGTAWITPTPTRMSAGAGTQFPAHHGMQGKNTVWKISASAARMATTTDADTSASGCTMLPHGRLLKRESKQQPRAPAE